MTDIHSMVDEICSKIGAMELDDKVKAINAVREKVHAISPFKHEPVDFVKWVPADFVEANDYNPNTVAPPEMELLRLSIANDGYTQPIVAMDCDDHFTVIDGFHRNRVGKECEDIQARIQGHLPLAIINSEREGINDRVASTVRHNRARGKHGVQSMADIVMDLKKRNWSDKKIAKELGMDSDEVLRLSQITGLAEAFQHVSFSEAWESEQIIEDGEIEE